MNVEYINPFLVSAVNVFRTMINCELTRKSLGIKESFQPSHELSGVIGLSGKVAGSVVLSVSREVALGATEALLGERPTSITNEVADAIGELTNIVAGQAKAQLEHLQLSIGLPNVIIGKNHVVRFPTGSSPIYIAFDSPLGEVSIEVGLTELL